MNDSLVLSFISNVLILLTVGLVYDYFLKLKYVGNVFYNISLGLVLGTIGLILALTAWTYKSDVLFDFSSILLIISGLFFGIIPTVIAMTFVGLVMLFIGDVGVWMKIAWIITSGLTGIFWSHFRPNWHNKNNTLELASMGISVTLIMLICTVTFPKEVWPRNIHDIPILILYPLSLIFFGRYMISRYNQRINNEHNSLTLEQWFFALEGTGEGVWDWNLKTNEVIYSKQWKLMLGYQENEFEYTKNEWDMLKHPDDKLMVSSTMNKYLKGEIANYELEYRLLCKDGTYKWILSHGKIISRDEKGSPIRFIGTHKDISDRKEKELLLAHERYLVESLLRYTPESIYFKDLNSKFIRVNETVAQIMGCNDSSQLIGKSDFDFYTAEFANITFKQEQEIIKTGEALFFEERGIRKDGKEIWGLTNKMPLRDANNNIIGTFGISIDITEIKEKELLLERERYLIDSLLKNTTESIYFKDLDSKFIRVNDQSARNMGCKNPLDVIGKSDFDFYTDEFANITLKQEQQIIRTGEPISIVEKGVRVNGKEVWGLTNRMPLRDLNGIIIGTFGISIDITEMKEKELLLEHERYLVDSLLKYTPESIFFKDVESKFIRVNDAVSRNLCCSHSSQLIGKSDFDFYTKEFATATFNQEQEIIRTGKPLCFEEKGIRKDGSEVWGLTNKMPLRSINGSIIGIFGISIDITQRKLVENALRKSQEELKSFAAHLQIVREEERVLLAREIHDELGQILIALKIDLGMLKQNVIKHTQKEDKEHTKNEFAKVFDLLDKTIKTTRKIMTGLRPEVLELVGVLEAVKIYSKEFSERYNIDCHFETAGSDIKVDLQQSIALFRIFQEALTNIAKHAKATEVKVNFEIDVDKIMLKISDNGIGIDENLRVRPDSYGLIGMKERVYLLDGKISITGQPENGTIVMVEMPYNAI